MVCKIMNMSGDVMMSCSTYDNLYDVETVKDMIDNGYIVKIDERKMTAKSYERYLKEHGIEI